MGVYNCCVTAPRRAPSWPHHPYWSGEKKRGKQLTDSRGQGVLFS